MADAVFVGRMSPELELLLPLLDERADRKSTRLNSSHPSISYAVFCLKKKKEEKWQATRSAIGSVTAAQGVTVTTEVAGLIRGITFESGAVVSKGGVLVRLELSSVAV